ncbi:serine/threonine protein kinase [Novipirellula rosea]|uniref:serine/threonine protein kinase n=1 Tax=Novipirellula rosea TaxID=1031540 RepID=UPI0031ED0FE7
MIELPFSEESEQLRRSVARIPQNQYGLPKLIDVETSDGTTKLLLSWCEGIDLATYYTRFRKFDSSPIGVWEAIRRAKSMAYSLSDLHYSARIIHADIKPANLILPSDRGAMFLIDFGSGWQIERTSRRCLGDGSNVTYSSPEIFQELDAVDARADQFSLAVVLFEMLTGKPPYRGYGGKAGHIGFEKIANRYQPPSVVLRSTNVPRSVMREIDDVLRQALQVRPEMRFPNSQEFAQALGGIWQSLQSKADHLSKHRSFSQTVWNWLAHPG